jgi:hypothetical protein
VVSGDRSSIPRRRKISRFASPQAGRRSSRARLPRGAFLLAAFLRFSYVLGIVQSCPTMRNSACRPQRHRRLDRFRAAVQRQEAYPPLGSIHGRNCRRSDRAAPRALPLCCHEEAACPGRWRQSRSHRDSRTLGEVTKRESGFHAAHATTEANSLFNYNTLFVCNNDLLLVVANHTVTIGGVRGVDCAPDNRLIATKATPTDCSVSSSSVSCGRHIRRPPLTSGDPVMSRKTAERRVKAPRERREHDGWREGRDAQWLSKALNLH